MELGKLVAQLGGAMLERDDFHALLQEAAEEIAKASGAAFVSVKLEQGGSHWEYHFDRHGKAPASFSPHAPLRLASPAGRRSRVVTAEGANAKAFAAAGLRYVVQLPVQVGKGESLELCIGFGEPGHALSAGDVDAMESVAMVLGVGASRYGFQQMAIFDPTTRLYNRRWLEAHLPAEIERARRYRHSLALLSLDVDHFKQINDQHGHPLGDRVLSSVAQVLLDSIRSCDYAVRVGGDEFLVVFPATRATGALRISRRILERVRALTFGEGVSPLRVTVSGGFALADSQSTVDSLLHAADAALYGAKRDGRDNIFVPERTPEFEEGVHAPRRERAAL